MRRFLLVLMWFAFVASSCTKEPPAVVTPEVPITKRIAFEIFTQKDYGDVFYDNALAEIRLSIAKIDLKDNKTTVVWDTTYDFRQFRQYPQVAQKIYIEKSLQHYENSETLLVSSVVRYNFNGYLSLETKGDPLLSNQNFKLVTVSF